VATTDPPSKRVTAARKSATAVRPAGATGEPAAPRRKPAQPAARRAPGTAAREPREPRQRRAAVPPPPSAADAGWRSGLGTLLRGSGGVLGQISGIDGPARSLERLARSAEKAGALLDRLDAEVGIDRLLDLIEHVERLTVATEEIRDLSRDMRRGIREIEERVVDLHIRVSPPLDRLPLTRRKSHKANPTLE
jgi:hypothetical protein